MGCLVRNADDLAAIVAALRSQGKTVVYTSGAFDLVHGGHVRALRNARSRGDYLVVGVHDDSVVKARSGAGHPLVGARERIAVLEALEPVDYVTPVHAEDPTPFLEKLHPDILACGVDEVNPALERKTVLGYGGRVYSVSDRGGLTTARLLRKIRRLAEGRATTRTAASRGPRKKKKAAKAACKGGKKRKKTRATVAKKAGKKKGGGTTRARAGASSRPRRKTAGTPAARGRRKTALAGAS